MSELAGEGAVAGRLEVIVEAALRNFATELKRKVEDASKGVKAKVGVEVDAEGLREAIQAKVDEAAAGVTAKIGVDFDAGALKAKVEAAAHAAATDVNVGADTKGITPEVVAATEAAEAAAGDVDVPVKAKIGTLLRSVIREKLEAQLAMLRNPVTVPVKVDEKGAQKSVLRLRGLIRGGLVLGIVSLIQPLLGAISQLIGGLTAMVAAAAPAVNTLAAFPISIGAFIQAMIAGKIATQGLSSAIQLLAKQKKGPLSPEEAKQLKQALGELSPSAALFAKRFAGLRDEWVKFRKGVQEPVFKALAAEIRPLAHQLLPVLQKGLTGTSKVFGGWVTAASAFLRSPAVKADIGRVMRSNNKLIDSFGHAIGDVSAGMLDFSVAARPFTRRIGDVAEAFGNWFRAKAKNGRDSGSTQRFLDKAGDRLRLIWHLTQNITGGFKGIFKAADGTGLSLLKNFNHFLKRWNDWANGKDGQKRLTEFFERTRPGFEELARLVHDMGIGFLKMGEDPAIVKLLEKVRKDIGPALSKFLTQMAHNVAPAVVDALAAILETLSELAPVTKGVAEAFRLVAEAIGLVAGGIGALGPLGDAVLNIAGFVVGYRLLTKLPLLGPLISTIGNLVLTSAGLKGSTNYLGMFARGMTLLKFGAAGAVAYATTKLTGMIDSTSETGKGFKAMANVAGFAAAGFLAGGPVGAAIGAGIGLMQDLSSASDKAREAFKEQTRALADYGDALDASNGKITAGIRKQAGLQLNKSAPNAVAAANSIGLPVRDVIGTMLGLEGATKRVRAALDAAKASNALFVNDLGTEQDVYSTLNNALFANIEGHEGLARSFANQRQAALAAADGAKSWKEALDGVAPAAQKALQAVLDKNVTNGKVFDGKQLAGLQKQFNLPDKQVRIIAKAVGVPEALRQYRELKKAAKEAADAPAKSFRDIKKLATTGFGTIPTLLGKGGGKNTAVAKQAEGYVTGWKNAVKQVIGAISNGAGPTKTASKAQAQAAKEPILKLPSLFNTYGTNMTQGLVGGMLSLLSQVTTAANTIAAEAARAVAAKAEIRSPSKVMKRLGRWISQGFAEGILGSADQVRRAAEQLFKRLDSTGHKGLSAKLHKKFKDDFKKLEEYAKKRTDLAAKLEAAQAKLDEITGKRQGLIDSVTQSGEDFSSVASIASSNGGFLNPGFLVGELSRRLASAKQFASALDQLRAKGFGEPTIRQIASEGIEGGLALAKQLLASTPDQVAQINALQGQITQIAGTTAQQTASALYDAGVAGAQGLVNGLKSQDEELTKVAKKLAKTIVKTIKEELDIKSPSRVTHGLGAFTGEGLIRGLRSRRHGLLKEARRMSTDLVAELQPRDTTSVSVGALSSARHAAQAGLSPAAAYPTSRDSAPLIGELSLTAGTPADAAAVLDDAMHALRKIKNGGVHADRVA